MGCRSVIGVELAVRGRLQNMRVFGSFCTFENTGGCASVDGVSFGKLLK